MSCKNLNNFYYALRKASACIKKNVFPLSPKTYICMDITYNVYAVCLCFELPLTLRIHRVNMYVRMYTNMYILYSYIHVIFNLII